MFSDNDLKQISSHELSLEIVSKQIEQFKIGFPPTLLQAPALPENHGLKILKDSEVTQKIEYYQSRLADFKVIKFVPASGAATRMFKTLFSFLLDYQGTEEDYQKLISDQSEGSVFTFFKEIERFAFYHDLKRTYKEKTGSSLEEDQVKKAYAQIIKTLLEEDGMDYGNLPKGLLLFHSYDRGVRTPVEEHMVEGIHYAKNADQAVKLHFTVSPDHLRKFEEHVESIKTNYESEFGVNIHVSYSIQKPSTDTIAVDLDNQPFRNEDQSLLFRPAGHGALLANLNDLESDVVFLKNVDNVVPDHLKPETIRYKKVIGGILLEYHERIASTLQKLAENQGINDALDLLERDLGFKPGPNFQSFSESEKVRFLSKKLHRPLRVCGMVKSDGDPGGGPFWVKGKDGSSSLQVVETAQIDLNDEQQKAVFSKATHFNPVDVVCMIRDHQGNKFDLMKHRDMDTGFITKKSKDGKDLKAQELPGLWNGSMADWNTVFVEVPAITFNPVKSVNDLLKKEHQG